MSKFLIRWRGCKYRARKYHYPEDLGCVPLDSLQTDDMEQFLRFVFRAEAERDIYGDGFIVEWSSHDEDREHIRTYLEMFGVNNHENIHAYER